MKPTEEEIKDDHIQSEVQDWVEDQKPKWVCPDCGVEMSYLEEIKHEPYCYYYDRRAGK